MNKTLTHGKQNDIEREGDFADFFNPRINTIISSLLLFFMIVLRGSLRLEWWTTGFFFAYGIIIIIFYFALSISSQFSWPENESRKVIEKKFFFADFSLLDFRAQSQILWCKKPRKQGLPRIRRIRRKKHPKCLCERQGERMKEMKEMNRGGVKK